jgi:hypothetical protein
LYGEIRQLYRQQLKQSPDRLYIGLHYLIFFIFILVVAQSRQKSPRKHLRPLRLARTTQVLLKELQSQYKIIVTYGAEHNTANGGKPVQLQRGRHTPL